MNNSVIMTFRKAIKLMAFILLSVHAFGQDYTRILGDRVNVRDSPNLNSNVLRQMNKGDSCMVLQKELLSIINGHSDNWYEIEDEYGNRGYIFGQFLSKPRLAKTSAQMFVLVVGVGKYSKAQHKNGFSDIAVCDGAELIYEFYKSKCGGNIPDDKLIFLRDQQATSASLLKQMSKLFAMADKDDVVLFYYTGHGNKGYLSTYDNIIKHETIKNIFDKCPAVRKLWIADSCHSASANTISQKFKNAPSLLHLLAKDQRDITYISSSDKSEVSWILTNIGVGVFTLFWLDGLYGEADKNGDDVVTLGEAFMYAQDQVSFTTKNYSSKQNSVLSGLADLQMPLSYLK